MRPRLKKSLLAAFLLLFLSAGAGLFWLGATESGLHWAYQQASVYIPGEPSIGRLEGRLFGRITATDIAYQQADIQVGIGRATVKWRPMELLTGSIVISRLHVQSLNVSLPVAQDSEQDQAVELPDIRLPLRVVIEDGQLDNLNITQGEQQFVLQQITLNASSRRNKIDIDSLGVVADDFDLRIDGSLKPVGNYQHKLNIQWHARLSDWPGLTGRGQSRGNLDKIKLRQQISGPLQLDLKAEARDLLAQLRWQANIDVSDFNLSRLDASWPAISGKLRLQADGDRHTASLAAELDGVYPQQGPFAASVQLQLAQDKTVQLEQLLLQSPTTDTTVNASGQWRHDGEDIRNGDIALELDWENLRWPLTGSAWFDSASGHGRIDGKLDSYHITLTADRPLPQAPPSTWYANASGNLEGLNMDTLRITALDGETTLNGRLDWSPRLAWDVSIAGTNINPAEQWPQWPGRLKANLTSTGKMQDGQLTAQVDITRVSGELRDQPVNLRSRLTWDKDQLQVKQFDLESGTAKVSAQGRVGEQMKLDWSINAANLEELYPRAGGQLYATGQISGTQTEPVIQTTFNGKALSLPGYRVNDIRGQLGLDLFRWQQVNINLTAEAIRVRDYQVDSLQVSADPGQLQLEARAAKNTARVELRGEAGPDGWLGRIEKIDLQGPGFDNWHLQSPVALNLVKHNLRLDRFCLQNQTASLCGELQQTPESWHSQLELINFPLQVFTPWLPAELIVDGVANGSAALQLDASRQLTARAHIELPEGAVSYPLLEGERDRWTYHAGSIDLDVDKQGLRAISKLAMSSGDQFEAKLALPDAQLLNLDRDTQPLQGSASLVMSDPGIIEALLPDVQDLNAELTMNLNVDGTLAEPRYSGKARLRNGRLRIPRLGLQLDKISMSARSEGSDKLSYELAAHSGDGDLKVDGQTTLDSQAGWPTTININGQAFEVARIPEARVAVSPELQIKLQGRSIDVSGEVHVPFARLQPKDVTRAARVSEDVVIVGGEQDVEEKWQITTRVRLTLGDRVSIYGFGFEGRLGGSLLLEDSPGQLTTATGEINVVEGRYTAYGQRLNVEHGRLLYTGGPVSNPGLDLRAVRQVNNVTAGIRVRGSLNRPDVELFSIPAMGQTDALAYLMLGRPLETASGEEGSMMAKAALALSLSGGDSLARRLGDRFGLDEMRVESSGSGEQASLVMGRYLAPKLYVSYGVGIVESFNTLNVRYQISDRWYIKGESGEHQSADILYTIER